MIKDLKVDLVDIITKLTISNVQYLTSSFINYQFCFLLNNYLNIFFYKLIITFTAS